MPKVRYRSLVQDSARWDGFALRPGDIVISAPPKCGTTWAQQICALLILQDPARRGSLAELSPSLDMLTSDLAGVTQLLESQRHRRFIKTHTPLDGLTWDDRVTYVCVGRDPRDVALSWDNHRSNIDLTVLIRLRQAAVGLEDITELAAAGPPEAPPDARGRLLRWIEDQTPCPETLGTLQYLLHHLSTWWAQRHLPNIVLVHYSDRLADLDGEMRRLAGRLGLPAPERVWPALVEAARFDQMRTRADALLPHATEGLFRDNSRFFRDGSAGQWRAVFDADILRRYQERVAALTAPDLAAWLHHEPIAG